jgi:hypothetical protein
MKLCRNCRRNSTNATSSGALATGVAAVIRGQVVLPRPDGPSSTQKLHAAIVALHGKPGALAAPAVNDFWDGLYEQAVRGCVTRFETPAIGQMACAWSLDVACRTPRGPNCPSARENPS